MQQTTFWKFLQNQKIEIPIIQRDYAQGRKGNEKLREKFLTDIKNALDSGKTMKLDFVYGSIENERLNPLDGQQRLTTLWLLHWYIAFKTGKLSENKEIFKRFTYETRTSSREFCNKLSEFSESASGNIVTQIQNQTWFYSAWKQDPTIQAMLNMLGGTSKKDNKDNVIFDGIEEVFENCNYLDYWGKLTSDNCPIIFYYLELTGLALSDDLYIKMNARGKSLTNFENFKADLVDFVKEKELDKDKEPQNTIAHKLDTVWTDIFWKNKSENFKIDEIYFAFFNRYFLNNLITAKKPNGKDLFTQEEIESNKLFKYLYGETGNDSKVKYYSFDIYASENLLNKELFERLTYSLDNFHASFNNFSIDDIKNHFLPIWHDNSNFRFIPEYAENKTNEYDELKYIPCLITQPHRVVFYAICCYFENNSYEEISFNQWMRVVWNIVENTNIEGTSSMIGAMRLIDELKDASNDIYSFLSNTKNEIESDTASEQVAEEREKARQIIENSEWKNSEGQSWEEKIIMAEKSAFFKGAIRFLFRVGENEYDWEVFDERFKKSELYFDEDGIVEEYKQKSVLLRFFISKFTEFDHFKIYYDNSVSSWKLNLLKYPEVVNEFFEIQDIKLDNLSIYKSQLNDPKLNLFQNDLVNTDILDKIISGCTFHWWKYGGYYSLYPYNTKSQSKILVLADRRNEILSKLEKDEIIKVDDWQKIEGLPYFRGWEIYFTLIVNGKKYQLWNCLKELVDGEYKDIEPIINLDNLETYLKGIKL